MSNQVQWFNDSPEAGDPACICSFCGHRIEEPDEENEDLLEDDYEGEPIRMWDKGGAKGCLEARFHLRCFNACLELGLVKMP